MSLKAVIFDLDGTLIDSMDVWLQVDMEFLKKRNIPVPEDLFSDLEEGNSLLELAKYFKTKFSLTESLEEITTEWTEMVKVHYEELIPLKPGVKELLDYLKANNLKIGVGTSNSKHLTEIVLKANSVYDYFSTIVAGCTEIKGKPFPDIFLEVANNLQIPPENCLVIEDTLVGIKAAVNAGMTAYAVYDSHSINDLPLIIEEADYYTESYERIAQKISRLL